VTVDALGGVLTPAAEMVDEVIDEGVDEGVDEESAHPPTLTAAAITTTATLPACRTNTMRRP
jgi:hypothetical protein